MLGGLTAWQVTFTAQPGQAVSGKSPAMPGKGADAVAAVSGLQYMVIAGADLPPLSTPH